MPVFNILSEEIDDAVPTRSKRKPSPVRDAKPAYPVRPNDGMTRSEDPKIKAEIARRMAAQKR